jgi:serine/threonine protein kinase
MALLKITDASGRQSHQSLASQTTCTIGRAPDNQIVLDDPRASRYHAHIRPEDDGSFVIIDGVDVNGEIHRSANKIYINGEQSFEHRLENGDRITIGASTITFELEERRADMYDNTLKGNRESYTIDRSRPFAYGRISVFFKGLDQKGDTVCIKVFRDPPKTSKKSLLPEFLREVTAQMTIKHPNILPIRDFGVGTSQPFLVLPMCEEGDLRSLMKARSFMPLNSALPILEQIALAIDHAHACGFIHGDIKPENILLTEKTAHCYLSDFGMSKYFQIVEMMSSGADLTDRGGGGTTYYLSPEQIDEGRQSPRSDIYSFAIVAYELLTGMLPFDQSVPPFKQMRQKIDGKLMDPFQVNAALPQSTRDALLQALNVESDKRPGSAFEFFQNLTRGVPTPQRPVEPGDSDSRKKRWASLEPGTKVAIITALIAALAGIITAIIKIIPELRK